MNKKVGGVVQVGVDILRKKALPVSRIGDKEKAIIAKMKKILLETKGIGLAAPQIGESKQIIMIGTPDKDLQKELGMGFFILINPKIIDQSKDEEAVEEGCLSFMKPEMRGQVLRPMYIKIEAHNEKGQSLELEVFDLMARSVSHETDHLNGVLFLDKADPATIYEVKKTMKKKALSAKKRLLFLSSSNFGAQVLEALGKDWCRKVTLVTAPDKSQGRGLQKAGNPAKIVAQEFGLKIIEVRNKSEVSAILKKEDYALAIVAGFSFIIPADSLISPKTGLKHLVLHPSLLPSLRGASPIQTALFKGLKKTGLCLFAIESSVDSGRVLVCEKLEIDQRDNYQTLEKKLAKLGAQLLKDNLIHYLFSKIKLTEQKGQPSFTKQIEKTDGKINFRINTARQIYNKFRAFYVWPGIYFELNTPSSIKKIKITDLDLTRGKLKINKVVPEGKKEMDFKAFLNGYRFPLDFKNKIIYP